MARYVRIVSLVPSLTQTLFDLGLTTEEIVGRTPWCIHPADMASKVKIVGGTKTPNMNKIRSLKPDLIVMDKEENPIEIYRTFLDEGFTIFVSEVESPIDVPRMLRKLGDACNKSENGEKLAVLCEDSINNLAPKNASIKTIPLIWNKPLMAVSPRKYSGAILTLAGFDIIETHPSSNGYPEISVQDFIKHDIELILLTSEPHNFTIEEGEEISDMIESAGGKRPNISLINGEDLTWFGSKTASALASLDEFSGKIIDAVQHQYHQ